MYISGKLRFWTSAFKLSTQKHHFKLSLWRDLHMSMHVSKCFTLKFARVTKSIDKKKIIATHRFGKLSYWLWKRILAFHFPSLTIVQNCFIEKQKKTIKWQTPYSSSYNFSIPKLKNLDISSMKKKDRKDHPLYSPLPITFQPFHSHDLISHHFFKLPWKLCLAIKRF